MAFFISTNTKFSGVFFFLQSLPVILMCSSFHVKLSVFFSNDSVLDCLVVMILNILIIIIITS